MNVYSFTFWNAPVNLESTVVHLEFVNCTYDAAVCAVQRSRGDCDVSSLIVLDYTATFLSWWCMMIDIDFSLACFSTKGDKGRLDISGVAFL